MSALSDRASNQAAAVLIVEDEPLVRTIAADIVMDAGYRAFEACDAADAIAILEGRDDIAAVFTEIEMPGDMNGLDLAAAIRSRWPATALLITSGRVRPGGSMLPVGADFIPKPYHPDELISQLAGLLA